ncbi:MAG: hypothetical protein R3300_11570 [Candidatus Promineifilaceae bacterium]|nr:hypothetical protein [Candidatus Promineifilaceae bacterium]
MVEFPLPSLTLSEFLGSGWKRLVRVIAWLTSALLSTLNDTLGDLAPFCGQRPPSAPDREEAYISD